MAAEALTRLINVTRITDRELRRDLRIASKEADRILSGLEGVTGPGADLRRIQISMAQLQVDLWTAHKKDIEDGIANSFTATADLQGLFDSALFREAGLSVPIWRASMVAQSQAGLDAYLSRKRFNYTLSQRVYRNAALSRGTVQQTINSGLLLGKSAKEIARDVTRFISPDVAGGQSYAAMRLARTEIQNAFHTSAVTRYQETPWVDNVKWSLSGSHGKPDQCNEYADDVHFRGGGAGVFHADDVPAKPHPQCLCYMDPIAVGMDDFVKNFHAGTYDSYLDKIIGSASVA